MGRAIKAGSVCMKTTGREAGRRAVVVEVKDNNFVVIEGPEIRKRKCNVRHLMPIGGKISVSGSAGQKHAEKKAG